MAKQQFDDTNKGVLFKNDRKETDKQPDYKGSININGTEFWLSGWKREMKDGSPMLSLSVTPKDGQQAKPQTRTRDDDAF